MATFSGGGLKNGQFKLNKLEKNVIDSILAKEVRHIQNVGIKAMKDWRDSIVADWFGVYHSESMIEATQYYTSVNQVGTKIFVNITSYVDSFLYHDLHERSADSWHEKYGGDLEVADYILCLQLYNGVIGLPEKATFRDDSNWVNEHFIQQEPLWNVIHKNFSNEKEWQRRVNNTYRLI